MACIGAKQLYRGMKLQPQGSDAEKRGPAQVALRVSLQM